MPVAFFFYPPYKFLQHLRGLPVYKDQLNRLQVPHLWSRVTDLSVHAKLQQIKYQEKKHSLPGGADSGISCTLIDW